MILAVTGGTGFVGARLIAAARGAGHRVRALTRRAQAPAPGIDWVPGALDTPAALADLVTGAEAVIHVAGVVNAPDRAGFAAGNIAGTEAMLAAAQAAGVARFVHVSSLAARAPGLSLYGWSKAEAEARVMASALDWRIVRPPAIYGPGDLEMLDVYRLAKRGVALLPPPGRLSLIAADDLAALLLALAAAPGAPALYEADDGTPGGWTHADYARAIGEALGVRVRPFSLPAAALMAAARLDRLARGAQAKLTPDRARYIAHPDWTIDPARRPPPALWRPMIATREGLVATAAWYRAQGLL
ncbi:MAG: epimerase [Proteobacteria bacterium SG_bin5]|nr:NAD(P)H-binding protein [Sphingomonas sp.]OQW43169.1 MAG: epimerase [Proteobacteria bacterium SG_bin5]